MGQLTKTQLEYFTANKTEDKNKSFTSEKKKKTNLEAVRRIIYWLISQLTQTQYNIV